MASISDPGGGFWLRTGVGGAAGWCWGEPWWGGGARLPPPGQEGGLQVRLQLFSQLNIRTEGAWEGAPHRWDSPAKRCQIMFLKMFVKKVFQLIKPFFANLHYTVLFPNNLCTQWPQNFLNSFFGYDWNTKNFMLISNLWKELKKMHPGKVICKNFLQISRIEEENPQFCNLLCL